MTADEVGAAVLGLVMLGIVVSAVVVPVVLLMRFRRRRRDARLGEQWEWAHGQCQRRGTHLAFVRRVYQYARRGCKADIVWYSTGQVQDTWFKGWHAPAGCTSCFTEAAAGVRTMRIRTSSTSNRMASSGLSPARLREPGNGISAERRAVALPGARLLVAASAGGSAQLRLAHPPWRTFAEIAT